MNFSNRRDDEDANRCRLDDNILIFDRLDIRWEAMRPATTFDYISSTERVKFHGLTGFELPGRQPNVNLGAVEISDDGLRFPTFGVWEFVCSRGVCKLILVKPDSSPMDRLLAISSYLMGMIWHSATDTYLGFPKTESEFQWRGLLQKLNFSDQPVGLQCSEAARLLGHVLMQSGFLCRTRSLINPNDVGHSFLECWEPDSESWIYLDPDFGVALRHQGRFVSADDVVRLRRQNAQLELEIVDLGKRNHVFAKNSFLVGFHGQRNWDRSLEYSARSLAHDPYYRKTVLDDGFHGLKTFNFMYALNNEFSYLLTETT